MSQTRRSFVSALIGGLVATLLLTALPATAGNGDPIYLGEKNTARRVTKVKTKGGVTFESVKAGNPAARFEVPFGTPPFSVNSSVTVAGLDADSLDGFSGYHLQPKFGACGDNDAPDGADYECTTGTISTETAGYLVASGSIELKGDADGGTPYCGIEFDDVYDFESDRDLDLGALTRAQCSTDASKWVSAGDHTVSFVLSAVDPGTVVDAVHLNVIFVPVATG